MDESPEPLVLDEATLQQVLIVVQELRALGALDLGVVLHDLLLYVAEDQRYPAVQAILDFLPTVTERDRYATLRVFAPLVMEFGLVYNALDLVIALTNLEYRARLLGILLPSLPPTGQRQLLQRTLQESLTDVEWVFGCTQQVFMILMPLIVERGLIYDLLSQVRDAVGSEAYVHGMVTCLPHLSDGQDVQRMVLALFSMQPRLNADEWSVVVAVLVRFGFVQEATVLRQLLASSYYTGTDAAERGVARLAPLLPLAGAIAGRLDSHGYRRSFPLDWLNPIQCYGTATFPTMAQFGQVTALRVVLTREALTAQAVALQLAPNVFLEVDALVSVDPSMLELLDTNVATIPIRSEADSDPVLFKLLPHQAGPTTITVEFFQNSRYLGGTTLPTTIVATPAPAASNGTRASQESTAPSPSPEKTTTQVAISAQHLAPQPDLTILCERIRTGTGTHYYRYTLCSSLPQINLAYMTYRTEETAIEPEAYLEATIAYLNELLHEHAPNATTFAQSLSGMGKDLYTQLIPPDLQHLYWTTLRHHARTVMVISDEPGIPWEVLYPCNPNKDTEIAEGFLCETWDMTRWLRGPGPGATLDARRMAVLVDTERLPATHHEATALQALFGARAHTMVPTSVAFDQILTNGGYPLVHMACHGYAHPTVPNLSTLVLTDGATLRPLNLHGASLSFQNDTPLVFLNACETGQSGYALTGHGGWADAFVRRAASRGFIGAMWRAHDESAAQFAIAFYTHLHAGKPLATAVRLARQAIKQVGDPTWLTYAVYANPLARLDVSGADSAPVEVSATATPAPIKRRKRPTGNWRRRR